MLRPLGNRVNIPIISECLRGNWPENSENSAIAGMAVTDTKKQRRKAARIHAHIVHQRKDFLHKQSRKITKSCDIVCIEDLDMKSMSRGMNFGKSVADNGWGMLTNFLVYKMEREGKQLVRIGRWYPSSKTCSSCGKVKKELGLGERIYRCDCGNQMDRDENAAINIRRDGLRMLGIVLDMEQIAS